MNYIKKFNNIKAFIFDLDGVLTNSHVFLNNGILTRLTNTKDGFAMKFAIQQGFPIGIITGSKDKSIIKRFKNLNINDIYLNSNIKIKDYHNFLSKYDFINEDILYMGDDLPDYEVMLQVGIATCPIDAVSDILSISDYVSPLKGGHGCVRDVIEQTLKVQSKWVNLFVK